MKRYSLLTLLVALSHAAASFPFLDREATGAAAFIQNHPERDGRGVILFVLDSGVDMTVPGLTRTTLDCVKVVDVHDFSGEGAIPLEVAESGQEGAERFLEYNGWRLYGYDALLPLSVDSVFYMGVFSERRLASPSKADFNGNGRNDDRYGVVVFQDTSYVWRAMVDLDADGNLHDETVTDDYAVSRAPLAFRPGASDQSMGIALKIDMDRQQAYFHFDANSHGTHVAGIAAGHNIGGLEGFEGIAPGARIISLKIGDARYGGAATTNNSMRRAYNFIAQYAEAHPNTPIVVNMSYGLGSEIEGASDMEYIINDLLESYNNIYVCLSAGNEGPGISSVGLPATAETALSIGAVNTARSARDNFASFIKKDKLFEFSSRGGESAKPDVVAPGSALSSVPFFDNDGIKSGTSMAAPQASGACALLLSATLAEKAPLPDMPTLKRAVKYSARPLSGYTIPDQGYGMIQIPAAYDLLKKINASPDKTSIKSFRIRTYNANDEQADAAVYWRNAGLFPGRDNSQAVYIHPVWSDSLRGKDIIRAFRLKTTANWLHTVQDNVTIKKDAPAEIHVYADAAHLNKPGLYSAHVEAYARGAWWKGATPETRMFDFPVTIIIPEFAGRDNTYHVSATHTLKAGDIHRRFIQVPPAASAMSVALFPETETGSVQTTLFDPEGHEYKPTVYLNNANNSRGVLRVSGDRLKKGIYEVVSYNPYYKSASVTYTQTISFGGLQCTPRVITRLNLNDTEAPSARFKVINRFNTVYKARIHGQLKGIQKKTILNDFHGAYNQNFEITDAYKNVRFEFTINARDFSRFTDCVVRILDADDRVVLNEAFTYRTLSVTYTPEKSGAYRLQVMPAFTNDANDAWNMEFLQSFNYFKTISVYGNNETFYPDVEKNIHVRFKSMPSLAPQGYYLYGDIWLDNRRLNALRTTVPIKIHTRTD